MPPWISRLFTILSAPLCWVGRHKYRHIRRLSEQAQQVGCSRCRSLWAVHHGERCILPWDYEFEMAYRPGGPLHTDLTKP